MMPAGRLHEDSWPAANWQSKIVTLGDPDTNSHYLMIVKKHKKSKQPSKVTAVLGNFSLPGDFENRIYISLCTQVDCCI